MKIENATALVRTQGQSISDVRLSILEYNLRESPQPAAPLTTFDVKERPPT